MWDQKSGAEVLVGGLSLTVQPLISYPSGPQVSICKLVAIPTCQTAVDGE